MPALVRRPRTTSGAGSPTAAVLAEQDVEATWSATDAAIAARPGIAQGDPVMHTRYVYLADGQPVQPAQSWEPSALTGASLIVLPEAGPHGGIGVTDRIAVLRIDVGQPVERVRARTATRAEAHQLGAAPGIPVLDIQQTYYDQATGRPVETADIVLLGERWAAEYGSRPVAGP